MFSKNSDKNKQLKIKKSNHLQKYYPNMGNEKHIILSSLEYQGSDPFFHQKKGGNHTI